MVSDYLLVLGVGFIAAALVMTVTAFTAVRAGRVSVVDTAWGIGLTLVAVLSAILGDGDPVRQWVLVGLVAAWGLRLSWHMHQRNHGKGEDPRYARMLGENPSLSTLVRKVYLLQGVAIWFVALPVAGLRAVRRHLVVARLVGRVPVADRVPVRVDR